MDRQAADHDVARVVRSVECFGGPVRERAVGEASETLRLRDRLAGGVHAVGRAVGRYGLGHDAGEVSGAAADVEHAVSWADAAGGRQLTEDVPPAAAEEDRGDEVVTSVPDEPARRASVPVAVPLVC
jgi:hypothetical protein